MSEWETHFKHLKLKDTSTDHLHAEIPLFNSEITRNVRGVLSKFFQIYLCVFDLTFHPFSADIFTLLTLFNFNVFKENSKHSLHLNIEKGKKQKRCILLPDLWYFFFVPSSSICEKGELT